MAASLALKDSSVARGNPDYAVCANFKAGRTLVMYVGGQYAGVQPTGPFGTTAYGAVAADVFMPNSTISAGAKTATAVDNTDGTKATASVTLT